MSPADYTLEETLEIIKAGMGANAAGKTERTIRRWIVKAGDKVSQVPSDKMQEVSLKVQEAKNTSTGRSSKESSRRLFAY